MTALIEHTQLTQQYITFYSDHGYRILEPVTITSRVDNTVFLVNSATNLFKKFILDKKVKVAAIQKSMRTQILNDYYREETETEFPTCFESYGALISLDHLSELIRDTIIFFRMIGFESEKMRIRACYDDKLLLDAVSAAGMMNSVELDIRKEKYAHVYGGNLTGRAVKLDYFQEWAGKHKNLCYFLAIYDNDHAVCAEFASSDQLILMRRANLRYAVSASKISSIIPIRTFAERRLADSITGTVNLLFEGIHPNSSNTNGRTLKKYIRAVRYFGERSGLSLSDITDITLRYFDSEYQYSADEKMIRNLYMDVK